MVAFERSMSHLKEGGESPKEGVPAARVRTRGSAAGNCSEGARGAGGK